MKNPIQTFYRKAKPSSQCDDSWLCNRFINSRSPRSPLAILGFLMLFALSGLTAKAQEVPEGCTGSGLGISLFVSQNTAHVGETLTYDVLVFNTEFPACLATAIVATITTPDGVVHPIVLRRTALNPGESDFYEGVVSYTIRAEDLRSNPDNPLEEFVRARANTDGDIHQNEELSRGGGFQGVNTVVRQPCIDVSLICVDEIGENGTITYTGTVTNCGDTPLVNVIVVYNFEGTQSQVVGPINLAIGETREFSFTVTPANPCVPVVASVQATARDNLVPPAVAVSVSDTAEATCALVLTPGIMLEAFCPPNATAGGNFVYSGTVTNDGNVTLVNVVVVSSQPAPNTIVFEAPSIAPGASVNFTGNFTAPLACEVTTSLSVQASTSCGVAMTDQATIVCPLDTNPSIVVTKLCPPDTIIPGQAFTSAATVQNTGNVTLNQVQVVSDYPTANTVVFSRASLAPGELVEFNITATAPLDVCAVTENLLATGLDACTNETVQDTASTTCPVLTNAAISVVHSCPTPPTQAGAPFTYTGTVTNTGDVTLNNVTVVSDLPAPNTVVHTVATLAPGASSNFTGTITAPANACVITSTLTARATDQCGAAQIVDTSVIECQLLTNPDIDVTLNCPPELVLPGHRLGFTGSVSNTGDVDLVGVTVVSQFDNTTVFGPATLTPGQTANFTGGFVVPEGINTCDFTSSVVATGNDRCTDMQVTDNASATCPLLTRPAIRVTRDCPPDPIAQGATLNYNGTVTNEGNITLINVVVFSGRPNPDTQVFTVDRLEPGESRDFTGSFTVPADCCSVQDTLRAEGEDICTGEVVEDTTTTICPVLFNPSIDITKDCPDEPVAPGETLTYTGTVTNTGDITLRGVTVYGSVLGSASPYLGPIVLAPGETVSYTGSYAMPEEFCGLDTVTVEGESLCGDVEVSDTVTLACAILVNPSIEVVNTCPPGLLIPGQNATFSGRITNTGNVTIRSIEVLNNFSIHNQTSNASPIAVFGPDGTLRPGQSRTFNFTISVPIDEDCCELVDQLIATGVSACTGEVVRSTSTVVCPIDTNPAIDVTFTECPENPLGVGAWVEYFGEVTNTGDIVLNDVTVTAPLQGVEQILIDSITLAPGESESFHAMYEKTDANPLPPFVATGRGLDSCTGEEVMDSAVCNPAVGPGSITIGSFEANAAGEFTLSSNALPGRLYRLQYCEDMNEGVWTDQNSGVVATSEVVTFGEPMNANAQARYYRVVEVQ